jgi:hypothetical protein
MFDTRNSGPSERFVFDPEALVIRRIQLNTFGTGWFRIDYTPKDYWPNLNENAMNLLAM